MGMGKMTTFYVDRKVLDEQSLEELGQRSEQLKRPSLAKRVRYSLRCSLPKLKRSVVGCLPVLYWLPRYSIWEYGMGDLIAGISVGIMHLPQSMAYALLASLPPVFGLYSSLYPALVYFFFGTSRHISIGTFTVVSIMIGSVTERLAPDSDFFILNGTNFTEIVDEVARDNYRVKVAAATTALAGIIQVFLGLIRFGFVATYLSEPLVRAYTSAAACHAVVAQFKYIFGISPKRYVGTLSLVYTLVDVCYLLPQLHIPTLVVSVVALAVLLGAKRLNSALSGKLPVPIPVELLSIVAATLISHYVNLTSNFAIGIVGEIPSGLIAPSIPQVSVFREVIGDACAVAVVGYAIAISLGKTFALKNGYKVESNQELVALGLSNTIGSFFHCYSISCSMSRSLVQVTAGGKTQVAGVVSALIVLVTILKLGPLFKELPKAVLSAIVLVNLKGMFLQYTDIISLWRNNKTDLVVWIGTWVLTLLFHLDVGLAASIAFALLTVIFRTQHPKYSVLGHVPGTEIYLDMEKYKEARAIPGVTIFHCSATVYFANADLYLEALKEKSGINITKMITYKKRQDAKQQRREKRAERRAKREAKRQRAALKQANGTVFTVEEEADNWEGSDRQVDKEQDNAGNRQNWTVFIPKEGQGTWEYLKGGDMDTLGPASELEGDTTTLASSSDDTLSHDLERISLGSLGKWTWDIHSIVLDFSTANFIDTVAIKTMRDIFQDFGEIDIEVCMAGCQVTVVEQLEQGNFFSDSITKAQLFATVHDAVLHCRTKRGLSATPSYECMLDLNCFTKM